LVAKKLVSSRLGGFPIRQDFGAQVDETNGLATFGAACDFARTRRRSAAQIVVAAGTVRTEIGAYEATEHAAAVRIEGHCGSAADQRDDGRDEFCATVEGHGHSGQDQERKALDADDEHHQPRRKAAAKATEGTLVNNLGVGER